MWRSALKISHQYPQAQGQGLPKKLLVLLEHSKTQKLLRGKLSSEVLNFWFTNCAADTREWAIKWASDSTFQMIASCSHQIYCDSDKHHGMYLAKANFVSWEWYNGNNGKTTCCFVGISMATLGELQDYLANLSLTLLGRNNLCMIWLLLCQYKSLFTKFTSTPAKARFSVNARPILCLHSIISKGWSCFVFNFGVTCWSNAIWFAQRWLFKTQFTPTQW